MNLHEYQAKDILKQYNVPIQEGKVIEDVKDARSTAEALKKETDTPLWVLKAQIHAGGRGKGGGVKLAKTLDEVEFIADEILGMTLVTKQTGPKGKFVNKLLIAQDVYYPGPGERLEFYLSILLDRQRSQNVIMYSTEGGVEIEEVAEKSPELIFKEWIDPGGTLLPFQARKIAFNLGLSGDAFKAMIKFITALYKAYQDIDASLLEINPLIKTSDDKILAVDAKLNLDDSALFRHPELAALRDLAEEDPAEVEAGKHNLNFIKLEGNVGCMVNGAGLAMATMDIIKLADGKPANFLDVGGTANAETVEAGFRIITQDKSVQAILINIFGGIVRCDEVAQGIIDACNAIGTIDIPLIVRLQGTNADKAKELIDASELKVHAAIELQDAADLVSKVIAN